MISAPPHCYFISDLHISKNMPQVALLFHHFCSTLPKAGDKLFILGDFLEYYIGADILDPVQEGALQMLKSLTHEGVEVFFMPGNRDFLINAHFLHPYNVSFLEDPSLLHLYNKRVLLTHGDLLCTRDFSYQRYRAFSHHPFIQWIFLHLPQKKRIRIAEYLHTHNPHADSISKRDECARGPMTGVCREAHEDHESDEQVYISKKEKRYHKRKLENTNYMLADAAPEAIEHMRRQYDEPDYFIYGHVHKMGYYPHDTHIRMVLGDWQKTGNYIALSAHGIKAIEFDLHGDRERAPTLMSLFSAFSEARGK